ncbi:MAG: hypothetical protein IKO35_02880 [Elusimicrobiaceae bacterium]|nr:hypothetical protein [Elusimicrobiaceae bacterium]
MKRFLLHVCMVLLSVSSVHATVFLVGRNIAVFPEDAQNSFMLKKEGHSYLVIIPNNPEKVKKISPLYAKWEKDIGCNKRGVIIGAYPEEDKNLFVASLQALVNADREKEPTQSFLCGTRAQKDVWNFSGGPVKTNLTEEEFIRRILLNAQRYISASKQSPVDYHAFRSLWENVKNSDADWAQNCNAFAFSLLVYSGASELPSIIIGRRSMPGHKRLLPSSLFYSFPRVPGLLEDIRKKEASKTILDRINFLMRNAHC